MQNILHDLEHPLHWELRWSSVLTSSREGCQNDGPLCVPNIPWPGMYMYIGYPKIDPIYETDSTISLNTWTCKKWTAISGSPKMAQCKKVWQQAAAISLSTSTIHTGIRSPRIRGSLGGST